jgi:Transposase and inactivated derivatives
VYGLERVTVSLPVLYRGEGEDEGGGVAQGGGAGAQVPPPARVGKAELWTQELRRGDFKYVVVDGKYVKLRGGRRGVLLIALGLTEDGVRAVLDVVLTREEDVVSYWDLPVRLWRYNLTLVVADGVKALDTAISRSRIQVARQTCLVHLKRSRRVRDALDSSPCPTRRSPTSSPPGRSLLLEQPDQSFNSLPESSASATPPGGSPRP